MHKSESFNSVSESQKSFEKDVARPKTLASLNKTDSESCHSPGNGSVPVSTLAPCVITTDDLCVCVKSRREHYKWSKVSCSDDI